MKKEKERRKRRRRKGGGGGGESGSSCFYTAHFQGVLLNEDGLTMPVAEGQLESLESAMTY